LSALRSFGDFYKAAQEAVERAKNGEGPTLIECDTYRKYGHFEGAFNSSSVNQPSSSA
jgi:TPP-dependent pyruvate/acetoin dehydrogenase alpha subunit